MSRRGRDPDRGQLPADHHAAGLAPLPGRGTDPPLPRALGNRGRLPGAAAHPARRVRAALPRPGRRRAGTVGAAGRLPGAADGHDRRRRVRPGHRPGPGQLHRRAGSRPRPGHRRPRHRGPRRPGRHRPDRPRRPGRPAARPPAALQRPQGQMLHLPLPRPRPRTGQDPLPAVRSPGCRSPSSPRPRTGPPRVPATQRPAARPPPAPARNQKRPGHPHHGQPARTRLVRTRTRGQLGIKPRNCSPSSPNGPASASSPRPATAGTPSLVRPDRPPPTAPDRNPEIATTLLTSGSTA